MKFLCSEKISQHKFKTPEGYLVCVDSVLARTGKQTYKRSELFGCDCQDAENEVEVDRTAEEVFSDKTLASFENKPLTIEHPDEDVNIGNHRDLAVGFARDIKRGKDNGQDVMLGTLVFTDEDAISAIESGEMVELSCGYDADIIDEENPCQRNIRGNHIALCQRGRAGNARIVDSKVKDSKWFDPEYDKYVDESYIRRQYESFKKSPYFKQTYEKFREENFIEVKPGMERYYDSVKDDMPKVYQCSGYVIVPEQTFKQYGKYAYIEARANSFEEAKRMKVDASRQFSGVSFVIINCKTMKIEDSKMKDKLVEISQNIISEFERKLSSFGLKIDGKGKTWSGRLHYQVSAKMLSDQFIDALGRIEYWIEQKGVPMTFSASTTGEVKTAGIDLDKQYVNDCSTKDWDEDDDDNLSNAEKELCDYMLENVYEKGMTPEQLLKKMESYYSMYQRLARHKPEEVKEYFKEEIRYGKYDSVKDSTEFDVTLDEAISKVERKFGKVNVRRESRSMSDIITFTANRRRVASLILTRDMTFGKLPSKGRLEIYDSLKDSHYQIDMSDKDGYTHSLFVRAYSFEEAKKKAEKAKPEWRFRAGYQPTERDIEWAKSKGLYIDEVKDVDTYEEVTKELKKEARKEMNDEHTFYRIRLMYDPETEQKIAEEAKRAGFTVEMKLGRYVVSGDKDKLEKYLSKWYDKEEIDEIFRTHTLGDSVKDEWSGTFDGYIFSYNSKNDTYLITSPSGKQYRVKADKLTPQDAIKKVKLLKDSKEDILQKIRSTQIREGDAFEMRDGQYLVQIQNVGKQEMSTRSGPFKSNGKNESLRLSVKLSSHAWGRIWKNGTLVFNESDALNVVRDKMIQFMKTVRDSKGDK